MSTICYGRRDLLLARKSLPTWCLHPSAPRRQESGPTRERSNHSESALALGLLYRGHGRWTGARLAFLLCPGDILGSYAQSTQVYARSASLSEYLVQDCFYPA